MERLRKFALRGPPLSSPPFSYRSASINIASVKVLTLSVLPESAGLLGQTAPRIVSAASLAQPNTLTDLVHDVHDSEVVLVQRSAVARLCQCLGAEQVPQLLASAQRKTTVEVSESHSLPSLAETDLELATASAVGVGLKDVAHANNSAHAARQHHLALADVRLFGQLSELEARLHRLANDTTREEALVVKDLEQLFEEVSEGGNKADMQRRGLDIDACHPVHGATALHACAQLGLAGVVQLLLTRGAATDVQAGNMATPLHWAAGAGQATAVEILLMHGADPALRTVTWHHNLFGKASGQTAAHWAAESGHSHVLRLIHNYSASVLALEDERSASPLALADKEGHKECVELLSNALASEYVAVRISVAFQGQRGVAWTKPSSSGGQSEKLIS